MWTEFHPQTARLTPPCLQPRLDDSSPAAEDGKLRAGGASQWGGYLARSSLGNAENSEKAFSLLWRAVHVYAQVNHYKNNHLKILLCVLVINRFKPKDPQTVTVITNAAEKMYGLLLTVCMFQTLYQCMDYQRLHMLQALCVHWLDLCPETKAPLVPVILPHHVSPCRAKEANHRQGEDSELSCAFIAN